MSLARATFSLLLAAATLAVLTPASLVHAADEGPHRHHLTLGAGYARHLSDDFEDSGLEDAAQGQFAYRYSVSPTVDLSIDGRSVRGSDRVSFLGEDVTYSHTTAYFGPGVRFAGATGSVRPFIQANVYFARETVRLEVGSGGSDASENGAGFGIAGGADIRLSRLLSLPIEANYLYAKPELDASSLGMLVGLTFNFGMMP